MDPLDTRAATAAASTDFVREASSIPRIFSATLVLMVLLQLVTVIAMPTSSGIVLFGVTALATWGTVKRHRTASRLLAGGGMFALAICALVSAGYLFFSRSMRAVFRKTEASKWSGGGA